MLGCPDGPSTLDDEMTDELFVTSEKTGVFSRRRRFSSATAVAALIGAACVAWPAGEAHAQAAEPNAVTGTAKGIVGGALLGAEVVMMPMGIAGLKPWWPYLVFGGLGSVGGAVGGWAVEQAVVDTGPAEAPLYMLAGGLALVIPTLVLTLSATTQSDFEESTDPSVIVTEPSTGPLPGEAPKDGAPPTDDTQPGGTTVKVEKTSSRKKINGQERLPLALVDVNGKALRVGIPVIKVKDHFTKAEVASFGVEQVKEFHIPVFSAAF